MAEYFVGRRTSDAPGAAAAVVARERVVPEDDAARRRYFVTYRNGPLAVHAVAGACTPNDGEDVSFSDHYEAVVAQGFVPCAECIPTDDR